MMMMKKRFDALSEARLACINAANAGVLRQRH